jgi:hypothetical protein
VHEFVNLYTNNNLFVNEFLNLILQRHFFRHSRENGNPGCLWGLKSRWIPAFAGMTDRETALFVGVLPVFLKVPL